MNIIAIFLLTLSIELLIIGICVSNKTIDILDDDIYLKDFWFDEEEMYRVEK